LNLCVWIFSAFQKIYTSKRRTTTYATFNNGLPVLPGFAIADAVQGDEWFPGPEVPPGWKPNPKRVWDSDPNKENIQAQTTKSEPLPYQKWKTGISAEEVSILSAISTLLSFV
jgi:G patch domain-containing protein 1